MNLFNASDFIPRGNCGEWNPMLKAIYMASQNAIALAYMMIPVILIFAMRSKDYQDPTVELTSSERRQARMCYSSFILFCGIGHFLENLSFSWPAYHFFTIWHLSTALVSWWAVAVTFKLRAKIVTGV